MGKGSNLNQFKACKDGLKSYYTWDDVRTSSNYIVINQEVYDVSSFRYKHPGGEEILISYIGQDATVKILTKHLHNHRYRFFKSECSTKWIPVIRAYYS